MKISDSARRAGAPFVLCAGLVAPVVFGETATDAGRPPSVDSSFVERTNSAADADVPSLPGKAPDDKVDVKTLPDTVVVGRAVSLLDRADSATQGTVGASQLADRPLLRTGELLETVPGVIITQHAGGGKANQYFSRGFNLDHGTDFAVFLDGMPINLPSHAHGQGYADMNMVIPELVERVNYAKGPYYADTGDFSSVGSAHLETFSSLPQNFVVTEAGMYGYARGVVAASEKAGKGDILVGLEAAHEDGPWVKVDDYMKLNGVLRYSRGDKDEGFSVTARAYHGDWNSSDQVAASAVGSGSIPLYGSLDGSTGGDSSRYGLQAEWHRRDGDSETKVMAYGFHYDLDLFSDFTYFLTDPVKGDQFEQADNRFVTGINVSHLIRTGADMTNTFGIQARNDLIDLGLYQTENRVRTDKTDAATGAVLPATTRADELSETSLGLYWENKIRWTEKFRTVAGLRGDMMYCDDRSNDPRNSGTSFDALPSPKLSLIAGPFAKTEFYLQGGYGFHSNDGRGTTTTVNPDGTPGTKIPGLIQTRGAEIGIRTLAVSKLQSTLSLWYMHSDSELLMEGDTGNTVASKQPSNRAGIEWANYYTPTKWLTFDCDYANSVARFTSPDDDGGTHVPEAIDQSLSAGVTLHDLQGFTIGLRLRYFGPRDLISDGSFRSASTVLLNMHMGYKFNETWSVHADIFNLLDRRDHDIDYAYVSQVSPTAAPLMEDHFHPVEPLQARIGVTARF